MAENQKLRYVERQRQLRALPMEREASHPHVTGTIAELAVAADLLNYGWHVFRQVDYSSCCDLVAIQDDVAGRLPKRTLFIEVRTALRQGTQRIIAVKHRRPWAHLAL